MGRELKPYLVVYSSSLMLWLLLAGSLKIETIVSGLLLALVVTVATRRIEMFDAVIISLTAPVSLMLYLGVFFIALVRSNIDMARRVLSPSLPINPEIVEIQTSLKSDLGKLLLANSITLTPGTLTVDVIDDRMIIHWIECRPGTDLDLATRAIAAGFEYHIRGFLK